MQQNLQTVDCLFTVSQVPTMQENLLKLLTIDALAPLLQCFNKPLEYPQQTT